MKPISKNLLPRVCLLTVIIAGIVICSINLIQTKARISQLKLTLQQQTNFRQQAESELDRTRTELQIVAVRLRETQGTLDAAVSQREAALVEATHERERALKSAALLIEARGQLDAVRTKLALFEISGLKPDQVAAIGDHVKNLQKQLANEQTESQILAQKLKQLQELYPEAIESVILPAELRAQVLVSDPKWHFVVINAGLEQGVQVRGKLLVSRNGKLVGRAVVRRVEKDRAIADLLPGFDLAEVLEGDSIIPADPRS